MQCETFESRIHTLLDQRHPIDADTSLAQHANECPACRRLLADYSKVLDPEILDTLALRADVAPPENLVDRVLSDLQPRQTSKASRPLYRSRRLAATLAVAASLLIATYVWLDGRQDLAQTNSSGMFVTEVEARQIAALLPLLKSLDQQGVETVCRVTGRSMATLPIAVWQVTGERPHDPSLATQSPWTRSVASGIRPLAVSMVLAIDALRSTLPSRSDGPSDPASTDTS